MKYAIGTVYHRAVFNRRTRFEITGYDKSGYIVKATDESGHQDTWWPSFELVDGYQESVFEKIILQEGEK